MTADPAATKALAILLALPLLLVGSVGTGEAQEAMELEPPTPEQWTVVIDPGHPSETSRGTEGPSGLTENHVNWVVAQKLIPILEERGYRVVSTKLTEDELVTNRHRADIATLSGADIMVRLHCDASDAPGTATFHPDRQGRNWGTTGPSHGVIAGSRALAERFHPAMIEAMGPGWNDLGIKGDSKTGVGSRQGALTGSIFSKVPVITVEMLVLTLPEQEEFISTEAGQDRMARALAAGIDAYFLEE